MAVKTKKAKHVGRNALIPDVSRMDEEFGAEFVGEARRVTHKVEARVKANAQRYGYFKREN